VVSVAFAVHSVPNMPSSLTHGELQSIVWGLRNGRLSTCLAPSAEASSALPIPPAIPFHAGPVLSGLPGFTHLPYGLSGCSAPLYGSDRNMLGLPRVFYFQASNGSDALPVLLGRTYNSELEPSSVGRDLHPLDMAN